MTTDDYLCQRITALRAALERVGTHYVSDDPLPFAVYSRMLAREALRADDAAQAAEQHEGGDATASVHGSDDVGTTTVRATEPVKGGDATDPDPRGCAATTGAVSDRPTAPDPFIARVTEFMAREIDAARQMRTMTPAHTCAFTTVVEWRKVWTVSVGPHKGYAWTTAEAAPAGACPVWRATKTACGCGAVQDRDL